MGFSGSIPRSGSWQHGSAAKRLPGENGAQRSQLKAGSCQPRIISRRRHQCLMWRSRQPMAANRWRLSSAGAQLWLIKLKYNVLSDTICVACVKIHL